MENQTNLPTRCRNCDTPIQAADTFCSNCGQKNTDGRITVGNLFSEFISATFNLDSKIFRTLRDLMIPGKLTIEYFKGRHKKYVHPVRLFLVTFIIAIGIGIANGFEEGLNDRANEQSSNELQKLVSESEFRQWFYDHVFYPNKQDSLSCIANLDSLECNLYEEFPEYSTYSDSITIKMFWLGTERISTQELLSLSSEELIEKYKIEGKFKRYFFSQKLKSEKDATNLPRYVISHSVWIFLFMMPFLGFLLHLVSYRKNKYYVEHIIFSLHTHAFAFTYITLTEILTSLILILNNWYFGLFMIIIPYLYFFIALKRVYQYNFGKNVLVFIILSIAYFILLILFSVLSVFVSTLLI